MLITQGYSAEPYPKARPVYTFRPGMVVTIGLAFRMGSEPGRGYLAPDGAEGVYTIVGWALDGQDLKLSRGDHGDPEADCDLWCSPRRATPIARAEGSSDARTA